MNNSRAKVKKPNQALKWGKYLLVAAGLHYTLKSLFIYKYSSNYERNPHINDKYFNFFGSKLQKDMENFELRVSKDQFTSKVEKLEK